MAQPEPTQQPSQDRGERSLEKARPAHSIRRLAFRFARCLLIAYLLVILAMMFFERSLIFFPAVYPQGDWQPGGAEFEDAGFVAADGTKLHGWFAGCDHPRAVVLFAPGNAGNVTIWADVLRRLRDELGASALAFDYRGYGRSQGTPSEEGILDDARAARAWLSKRTAVPEKDIVLMGRSLGGSVMIDLAAKDGARGLIVESSFTSLPDVAAVHYPWLPVRRLMRTRLESIAKIGGYRGPVLISHGDADEIVPFEQGVALYSATNEPKRFWRIAGGEHNDPQPDGYYRAVAEFLASLPK